MKDLRAVVAGGTGLVGNSLLKELSGSSEFKEILVLVRRAGAITLPAKAIEKAVDYHALATSLAGVNATHWYCALGTTIKKAGSREAFAKVDRDYVIEFAKAAKANGCKSFNIVTALGADPKSKIFYNKVKGESEEALRAIGFESLNIFRPSLLDGERSESRPGERVGIRVARALSFLIPKEYRAIRGEQVARAMLGVSLENRPGTSVISSGQMLDGASR